MIYFESDMSVGMKHMRGRDVEGGCWPSRKLRAHDVSCAVGLIPLGSEAMTMVCLCGSSPIVPSSNIISKAGFDGQRSCPLEPYHKNPVATPYNRPKTLNNMKLNVHRYGKCMG